MESGTRHLVGLLACLGAIGVAWAQSPVFEWKGRHYGLGSPSVVAGKVTRAFWSPDGADIAYTIETPESTFVGLFDLKRDAGGIVAGLGTDEHLDQIIWLNAGHKAIIASHKAIPGRAAPTDLLTVRIGDAQTLKGR